MKPKIKILITNLSYLNHNYGAQGIAFPFMKLLGKHFDVSYTFCLAPGLYEDNTLFAKKNRFNIIKMPKLGTILVMNSVFFSLIYRVLKRRKISDEERSTYLNFEGSIKQSDVIIDLSGIEFIGDQSIRRRWSEYFNLIQIPILAKRYGKLYLKYTKSYGPFPHFIHRWLVKRHLKNLPFIFVRGDYNLELIRKLHLHIPCYSFPDVSFALTPADSQWARAYLRRIGVNINKKIIGLSPSAVVKVTSQTSHELLCEQIIKYFKSKKQQILLIPHSVGDTVNIHTCDLALSRKIYGDLKDKEGVYLLDDKELTYAQVRALIGLLDFYISGRYHSITSALSMGIPVVPISWHIKYKDVMSQFLKEFPIINCSRSQIDKSLNLIKEYYNNREWFPKNRVRYHRLELIKKIEKSIEILAKEIQKWMSQSEKGEFYGK